MSRELQPSTGFDGSIERFGASHSINDQLVTNYRQRGLQAAQLLVATLTETPYAPEIYGNVHSIEVSNRYEGSGVKEGEAEDTVEVAAAALDEFTNAKVPGAKKVKLRTFRTRYGDMFDDLKPGFRTPNEHKTAFQQAFVNETRRNQVAISSYGEGAEIIKGAPKKITGLLLDDRTGHYHDEIPHDLLTKEGRLVRVMSYKDAHSARWYMPRDINLRGGRAPGSTIVSRISSRVIDLSTRATQR